jgi:hypothetical protein
VIIEEGAEDVVITVPGRILGIDDWRAVGIELEIGERTIERSVHDGGLFIVYPAGGSVGELRVKEGTETLTAFPAATGRFENIEIAEEGL